MKKTKFIINTIFILFGIAIIIFASFLQFIIYLIAVLLHEIAHYVVAKKLGYKLDKFYIMPYGVCLNYENTFFSGNDELLIASAGPIFNILICIICLALWWLFPETYYILDYFCFCNLVLATFNILPCFPLDGGRIVVVLLSKFMDRAKALKIVIICNYIFSATLLILFIISIFNDINFSYLFVSIFLFAGNISPEKMSKYEFITSTRRKNLYSKYARVKMFAVSSTERLYKIISKFSAYKFNIVYIVDKNGKVMTFSESNIISMANKFGATASLEEVMLIKSLDITK